MPWKIEEALGFLTKNYQVVKADKVLKVDRPGLKGLGAIDFLRSKGYTVNIGGRDV